MNRIRWGARRVDRLAGELAARAADLSPDRARELLDALRAEIEGDDR